MKILRLLLPTLVVSVLMLPGAVLAQEDPARGVVAIGPGVMPEYDGSDDLRLIPFVMTDVRWRGMTFEFRGLRGRADLAPDSRLELGPVVSGRLTSDAEGAVGRLPEIDTAFEVGGYIGYRFSGDMSGQGSIETELTVVQDVSGAHDGLLATASVSYAAIRRSDLFVSLDLQSTWADADYTRTYFGIDEADALVSGLDAYRPDAGVRDVGFGVTAGYWFGPRLGVIGRVGANYLVGDVSDSPVVDLGERWQPTAGLTLAYRF